jgi:hypothetical protein
VWMEVASRCSWATGDVDRLSGNVRNGVILCFSAWNNQLRTGADKGNPTV